MNLNIIIYSIFVYGLAKIMIDGEGPFGIIEKFRNKVDSKLFRCPLCFSTNIGWIMCLVNALVCPTIAFTPSALLGLPLLLGMAVDAAFSAGITYTIWNINDYIDKITPHEDLQ